MSEKQGNQGEQLERLIAMLESTLANGPAKIESPSRRLKDRDTGQVREHDVLITWDHGHHEIYTAIECRDRSRPVGVPDIEAFSDKCGATGIHSGVVVSASGFRDSARKKAAARSITCMDISEVQHFEWIAPAAAVYCYERQFRDMHVHVIVEGDVLPADIDVIFDTNGLALSNEQISQTIFNVIPVDENCEEAVGVEVPVNAKVKTIDWTARDIDGKIWNIDHLLVSATYATVRTVQEFASHRYSGGGKDYRIASALVSTTTINGRIMLVKNDDDSTSVFFTPDNYGTK
jgi:Restriction endonuclease